MKILLDPLLYWFDDTKTKNKDFDYLEKVTSIVEKYFNIKYISTNYFIQIVKQINKEPFGYYAVDETRKRKVMQSLLYGLDYQNNINNLDGIAKHKPLLNFSQSKNDTLNEHFMYVLNYIKLHNINCLLMMSLPNQKNEISDFPKSIHVVNHISGEIDSKLTELLLDDNYINQEQILIPNLSCPLPYFELCDHFYYLQKDMQKRDDDLSVFLRITKEVALRNRYVLDKIITNKNNSKKHKRKIYSYNKNHYISADFETGCFELCDNKGKHKGEISYIGEQLSPPDKTGGHDIKV